MVPDIISFEKTQDLRLAEFKEILCNETKPLAASQVQNEWCYYAAAILEPLGWQAVWKLSQKECEKFSVPFPMAAFVMVESTNFQSLEAIINVLNVPGDVNLPNNISTSLLQLYPTVTQVNDALYVYETANCLEQMRFFYNHLWHPWDIEDDETQDWVVAHLDDRLQLYFDKLLGKMPSEMAERITSLLLEAQQIQQKISSLEDSLEEADEDSVDEIKACNLIEFRMQLHKIKKEMQVLESPVMRNVLSVGRIERKASCQNKEKETYFVWLGGQLNEYIDVINKAQSYVGSDLFVKPSPLLQEALDGANRDDTILICPGVHGIRGSNKLECGGSLKGFDSPSSTIITARDSGSILIECMDNNLTLENLKLDGRNVEITILVHSGTLHLRNCHLIGQDNRSATKGILVLGKGKAKLEECVISSFGTGIYINSEAEVYMKSCDVSSCHVGIQVFDGANLSMKNTKITKCLYYGIKYDVATREQKTSDFKIGSDTLLSSISEIKLENTEVQNNVKGDVVIAKTHRSAMYVEDPPFYSSVVHK